MNTIGLGPNFTNYVTPFVSVGRQAVGLENAKAKEDPLPPVEESAESARTLNRRSAEQRFAALQSDAADVIDSLASDDVIEALGSDEEPAAELAGEGDGAEENPAGGGDDRRAAERGESDAQQRRQIIEQQEIRRLASRDREVRAHEAAHAAVGGQFAGAPSYQYARGPDGVAYAIAGEVPISLSQDPNNPAQTLQSAEQVRRAALAPADPSGADLRIAARATQVAQQARANMAAMQAAERARVQAEREAERDAELGAEEEQRAASGEEPAAVTDTDTADAAEKSKRPLPPLLGGTNQRLFDLPKGDTDERIGSMLDQRV